MPRETVKSMHVYFHEEQLAWVKSEAKRQDRSPSWIVRKIVDDARPRPSKTIPYPKANRDEPRP